MKRNLKHVRPDSQTIRAQSSVVNAKMAAAWGSSVTQGLSPSFLVSDKLRPAPVTRRVPCACMHQLPLFMVVCNLNGESEMVQCATVTSVRMDYFINGDILLANE